MKKIYLSLCLLVAALSTQAQLLNPGMETWRTYSSGGTTPVNCEVPTNWYGIDSIIIADGQAFGSALSLSDTNWHRQVFKDSGANAHGGTYSAKLVTKLQSTYLGKFPGIISNAKANITITPGLPAPTVSPITYTGGTATTLRTTSVSAWVKYNPASTADSAELTVSAYGSLGSVTDTLVGSGFVKIGPNASFVQVTAMVNYTTTAYFVDLVRIGFASSCDTTHAAINSTLWVDDVTMGGVAQTISVNDVHSAGNVVNVYPNPAMNIIHMDGQQNEAVTFTLVSITGQVVATASFTGKGIADVSMLPSGLYFYTIADNAGNLTQRGKVSISK